MVYTSTVKKIEVPAEKREVVKKIRESICSCGNSANRLLRNMYYETPERLIIGFETNWEVFRPKCFSSFYEEVEHSMYIFTYKQFLRTLNKSALRYPERRRKGAKVLTYFRKRDSRLPLVVEIPLELIQQDNPTYTIRLTSGEELEVPIPKTDDLLRLSNGHQALLIELSANGEYVYCMSACSTEIKISRGWRSDKEGRRMEAQLFTYMDEDCFSKFCERPDRWKTKSYALSELITLTREQQVYLDACALRCNSLRNAMLRFIERHRELDGRILSTASLYAKMKRTQYYEALPCAIAIATLRAVDKEYSDYFSKTRAGVKAEPPQELPAGTRRRVELQLKETKKPRTFVQVPRMVGDVKAPEIKIPIPAPEDGYSVVKASFVPTEKGSYILELLLKESKKEDEEEDEGSAETSN